MSCPERPLRLGVTLALGATVGTIAGLVGAGGGFMIVPALVLVGGLTMQAAVATSLLVMAMQSVTGLLGHLGHLDIDWTIASVITPFAVVGSVIGGRMAGRVEQRSLRRGFAAFIGVVGVLILGLQLMPPVLAVIASDGDSFVVPLIGGALIGLAAALFWILNGRIAGVSGIAGGLLRGIPGDRAWRTLFLVGLVAGGLLMRALLPSAFEATSSSPAMLVAAGLFVGVGTTLANGCTSGHGVCGASRLSPRSMVATGSFMLAGMLAVYFARHVAGALL